MKKFVMVLTIFAMVIGVMVFAKQSFAWWFGLAQNTSGNQFVDQVFNSKAVNTRLSLNALLREHTVLAAAMLKGMYMGEDTTRLQQLLGDNQGQLANMVEQSYGTSARDRFNQLWSAHMQEYINYTNARKNNDTDGMNQARNNLQDIAGNIGDSFAGQNLSSSTVSDLMMQHINGTLAFVDAVANNDTTQQANIMKQGYDQAGVFADTLARGIMMDKPDLFQ